MKKILITGKNSYVGNSFATWLDKYPEKYEVNKMSVRNDDWKQKDFSLYDVVVHVAGIAHRKETEPNKELYFYVNRDLTYEIAKKAKNEGVNQFIFISSMSVYGMDVGIITRETMPHPKSYYGKSKLEAEKLIRSLHDEKFKITIVRPPIIYGKNCPGNYQRLRRLALKTPVFPKVNNARSMIYIDNLSEFLRIIINKNLSGIFLPQNKEYVNITDLVKHIATANNKNIYFTKIFNPIIKGIKLNVFMKLFGSLIYKEQEEIVEMPIGFTESINKTEGRIE